MELLEPLSPDWFDYCTLMATDAACNVSTVRSQIEALMAGGEPSGNAFLPGPSATYAEVNQVLQACAMVLAVGFVIRVIKRSIAR